MTLRIAAPEASLDIDLANAVTAGVGRGDRGRGLAGMRERAQTLGGRMSAGPRREALADQGTAARAAPRWRMTIGVLIVDDEELVRVGLRAIVAAQPDLTVLGEASDGPRYPRWWPGCAPTWC